MKEKLILYKNKLKDIWTNRSKGQKTAIIASGLLALLLIGVLVWVSGRSTYVPLYSNLTVQEVSQIKTELDTRGIPYEIKDNGATINVPEENADSLLVDLAGQGIPDSGNIDYSFFSENASWGITDNEFDMMKLDATQTELSNLIKQIDGIHDAKVMINMPKEALYVSDKGEEASASIVLNTKPGYQFKGNQVDALYHLVSKAVPNLPEDNIVIMNQYFEYFDQNSSEKGDFSDYASQQAVKRDIERDIQRRLQQMVGAMVGQEKAIVSVTADVDFTKENRKEDLIEPVDVENMEGLPVSIETVNETYTGKPPAGGVAGTGEEDVPGYQGTDQDGNGDYKLVKETVNNEFNKIRKDIVESPYKIRDLGIQVAIDNIVKKDGDKVQTLSTQEQSNVENGLNSILNSMITTSIDKEYGEVDPTDKVSIVFEPFNGTPENAVPEAKGVPMWMYITGGILLAAIIVGIILYMRKRRNEEEEYYEEDEYLETIPGEEEVPDIRPEETEAAAKRKQLEKMAKEKPEEFSKLLRSWISED
ncbi:flagellar basal-body MS-ring/collar protein FliF [Aciduricibacillus chroicocephali]|uniref:Flagellar M-ring protein n=1 Tax=Aciduricibacillus chroicocephali TaxID=3054939 RepID=A0ABY9L1T1_9BACI|nr:flagellar basal-body MS-ring/collar protein FliF [Bacillaceae bacterium 44XB]